MGDLLVGYAVIGTGAIGLFLFAAHLASRLNGRAIDAITLLAVAGLFGYIRFLWFDPVLARWLPFSNLIVVGNWLPFFASAIAGFVWRRISDAPTRRWTTTLGLVGCGILAALFPLLGSKPQCGNRWDQLRTCLQTTRHTCSAASAAMLLDRYGIVATEQEMAELCLTRHGTNWQGLYRGLKLKTTQTPWDVEVSAGTIDEVLAEDRGPLILTVGLAAGAPADTPFTEEFGWVPGVGHSVLLERCSSNGSVVIADPAQEMCRESWSREQLEHLWRGYAFRLVPRR
ncbi:MAG: hypothetical protein MUF06_00135 [Pirellulaceae bacterium]|jgi:hypothetical protein|nr:hypothetical protein [Pirellulaceae bacterium]